MSELSLCAALPKSVLWTAREAFDFPYLPERLSSLTGVGVDAKTADLKLGSFLILASSHMKRQKKENGGKLKAESVCI